MTLTNKVLTAVTTLMLGLSSVGCASHTGNAALIGGTAGALTGAAIGSVSHQRAGEGALLGGAIGAIGGAIVGNEMDRQGPPPQYADDYGSAPAAPYDGGVSVHYETRTYSRTTATTTTTAARAATATAPAGATATEGTTARTARRGTGSLRRPLQIFHISRLTRAEMFDM